jgi:hypothetical protein
MMVLNLATVAAAPAMMVSRLASIAAKVMYKPVLQVPTPQLLSRTGDSLLDEYELE